MTVRSVLSLVFLSLLFALPQSSKGASLVVGNNAAVCPSAQYATIQAGVNAAATGETIEVCPGTYPEQVTITKSVTIAGDNGAIVMPGPVSGNATDVTSGAPIAAIILVQGATDVTIDGLIVDGSNNGLTQCTPVLIGILYENASGSITHNAVRSMSTPAVSGCQGGDAIVVLTGSGQSSAVDIAANSVHDYQKNGITGDEDGTTVTIHDNTVTESAPATGAAPNGIQIGFGAAGKINGNTVSGNVWGPCVSVSNCSAAGTGILIYESDSVSVKYNSVGTNQFGIAVEGNKAKIENNSVYNSLVPDGIVLMGNDNEATSNTITHSDQAAVAIQGNDNTVQDNTITDALTGILTVSGSSGNTESGNTFHDTVTKKADPASPLAPAMPGPAR